MEVKEEMEEVEAKTSGRPASCSSTFMNRLCPVSSNQLVGMTNEGPLNVSEVNTVTTA